MTLRSRHLLLSLASFAAIVGTGAAVAHADSTVTSATPGIVAHINILSDKSEDVSSPEAWKKTYIKDGMTDQDKAIAIWKSVVRYRHQDNPPGEGLEDANEKHPDGNVHEPIKTFQVYGYGMCCCAASDIEGLARYIGMPARGRIINNHSVPEVWYNDSWHLFDASLCFFLQKPDANGKPGQGDVASVDEMKASIEAWKKEHPDIKTDADRMNFQKDENWKKNGPALFAACNDSPTAQALGGFYTKDGWCRAEGVGVGQGTTNHGWNSNMVEYNYKHPDEKTKMIAYAPDTKPAWNVYDYGAIMGYELNVELREGEKITRCWYAKDIASGLNQRNAKLLAKFLAGDMTSLSLQQALGDKNPGRIGNGTDEYDALADSKLTVDTIQCDNLALKDGKLRIVDAAKPATLVVHMPCSYVYLGGDLLTNVPQGTTAKASISLNNGLDWTPLATLSQSSETKTDLHNKIFDKYDYRVKFEFTGAGSGLDELKLVNRFQHSQAPLPVITEGDNKISFSADQQAIGTVSVQGNMEYDKPSQTGDAASTEAPKEGEAKAATAPALAIADFHPTMEGSAAMKRFAIGSSGQGAGIIPVTTPGDITGVRVSAHWRARDPKDGYTVSASFDNGQSWKEVGKMGQANPATSTYFVFTDVPAGAKNVQVKFDGTQKNTTCIFDLRVDVDYKEPTGGFRPVKVTYNWEEGDKVATPAAAPAAAPAAGQGDAPADGGKKGKGAKNGGGKKGGPGAAAVEMHGTPKTDSHVFTNVNDSWTLKCGPNTVARSYTIELVNQ